MKPRRAQQAITIRSDKAAALLAALTRNGRSQVEVIEEALDRTPLPDIPEDVRRRRLELEDIVDRFARHKMPSMAEFDAMTYDERGLPR